MKSLVQKLPKWIEDAIRPLPTWVPFDTADWKRTRGHIVKRPPSRELRQPETRGYLAGLVEGEAWIGYARFQTRGKVLDITPVVYLDMKDPKPIEFAAKMLNMNVYVTGRKTHLVRPRGLRTIMFLHIIEPLMKGKAKEKATFLIEHGYKGTEELANEFIKRFGGKHHSKTLVYA